MIAVETQEAAGLMLQAMFQAVAEALFLLDPDGKISAGNDAAARLLGRGRDELIGWAMSNCLAALAWQTCDVMITDLPMKGMDGLSLLQEVRRRFPWLPTLVVTGYGAVPSAVAAMKIGVVDFLEKPRDRQELLAAVGSSASSQHLSRSCREEESKETLDGPRLGRDPQMIREGAQHLALGVGRLRESFQ